MDEPVTPVSVAPSTGKFSSWTEPELPSLDGFASMNSKYEHCIVTVYQIVRDLHIKQEVAEIQLIDASIWNINEYFIEGVTRISGMKRLMVPMYLDAEIDLVWLHNLAKECAECNKELYICVHTPEAIIYELVSNELP